MNKFRFLAFLGLLIDISGLLLIIFLNQQRSYGFILSFVGTLIFVWAIHKWHRYNQCKIP